MALTQLQAQLTKLVFIPCSDAACTEEAPGEKYEVMYNPHTLAVKLQIDRDETQADGETSATLNFKKIKPQDYSFEFLIDGTGVNGEAKKDVPAEVEKFLRAVYEMDGEEHQPRYVKILYGSVLLKCALKNVDITYNLFAPDGKPLRAKMNAVFASCSDQELSEMINKRSSPDLTHRRVMKGSDRLVALSNKIYKNNQHYLELARANNLDSFRSIKEGTQIFFPPLAKA